MLNLLKLVYIVFSFYLACKLQHSTNKYCKGGTPAGVVYIMTFSIDSMIKVDESVVRNYHIRIIKNFEERGWACYKAGPSGTFFLTEKDVECCVKTNGREKNHLKKDVVYTLLPLVDNSFCWKDVKAAMAQCVMSSRYPFFVDLESYEKDKKEYVKPLGVYLIDSVLFNSEDNTLELVVEYDLMLQLGITFEERPGNIVIDMVYVDKILKQLTKQTR
jgi:hypothetical protein